MRIVSAACLPLTGLREVAHTLQITDDTRHVVYILRVALRTLVQIALIYRTAIIAYCIRYIESEIIASLSRRHVEQLTILCFREVFFKIHVQCRTTCEVLNIRSSMQLELVDDIQ